MSTITGLGSYASSYLNTLQSTLSESRQASTNTLNNQLAGQNSQTQASLTDQLAGLVRLTRYAMDEMGLADDSRVTFSRLQEYCDSVEQRFNQAVKDGLGSLSVDPALVTYTLSEEGKLTAHSADRAVEALAQLACDEKSKDLKNLAARLKTSGVSFEQGLSFSLNAEGQVTALGASAAFQEALQGEAETLQKLSEHILAAKVDANCDFSLKINADDSVTVNAAKSEYRNVLQAFFDQNSDIVSDYRRCEALSQIEEARKFMGLSPKDMRTRLQLESLAAWWDNQESSSSQSSFGLYNNGALSRLSGINISV
ncbi:MAG: hypothetical protein K6G15_09320 [Desulfovibrio sp.]|nr:hypothetical protein [Desulfovibrio sp.]